MHQLPGTSPASGTYERSFSLGGKIYGPKSVHTGDVLPTVHIEHPISDLGTWFEGFHLLAGARRQAGVTAQRVFQPVDDDKYILVQLDFDTVDAAERFKSFLESVVWRSEDLAPALAGTPRARVLREAEANR